MGKDQKKALTKREERRLNWWKQKKKEDEPKTDQKKDKESKPEAEEDEPLDTGKESGEDLLTEESDEKDAQPKAQQKSKKKFYVLFVGNLPYNATSEDIQDHFQQIGGIKEIRLLTDKKTGKSKGCAYIEFLHARYHKLALTLHHSKLKGRQINVEFTSAGRKTDRRTQRLKLKNQKGERFKVGLHFKAKLSKK